MFPQIVLLPSLGNKEAIGTLGYPIASKLGDQLGLGHSSVHRQTHTGLYNIDSPLNSANLCSITEVTLSSKRQVLLPPIPSAYLQHPCHKEFFQTHLYWQQTLLLSTLQSGNGLAKDNQILAAGSQTFKPKSVQKIKNRATVN